MRTRVKQSAARRFLIWMQRLLLACGLTALGYCGFALLDSWTFQNRDARQLEQMVHDRQAEKNNAPGPNVVAAIAKIPAPRATDDLIGRLAIPRLGMSVMVTEGATGSMLRRAVGHIAGTAFPGQPGNVGIAGHRDTFFRPLRNIRANDVIRFTTPADDYWYRVVSTTIVSPTDVAMLEPGVNQTLTLVTCYPFNFVGSSPSRFIVRAERVP